MFWLQKGLLKIVHNRYAKNFQQFIFSEILIFCSLKKNWLHCKYLKEIDHDTIIKRVRKTFLLELLHTLLLLVTEKTFKHIIMNDVH